MKKVLLHICCGVCAFGCIENLRDQGYHVEGYFFNPNIHPEDEYQKRARALDVVMCQTQALIHKGEYTPSIWFEVCKLYKEEEEGSKRCDICCEIRLKETQKYMRTLRFDSFTTTLTISPHKDSKRVFEIGKKIAGEQFLAIDFKKKDGFKRTQELSRKYNIYHQKYCGCIYSLNEKTEKT